MRHGKSLKIFLIDGLPTGIWTCELSNWTGKAYKIPRTQYKKCLERTELRSPSVYLLFGHDNETGNPIVYIGETEDPVKRLGEHIQDIKKEYWNEAIIFFSKDDHLNKAHIKYLESRLYQIASEVKRYLVMNSQPPKKSAISEAEVAEMEEFIDNIKIIVPALGHKVFDTLVPLSVSDTNENSSDIQPEYLYIRNKNGISAKGFQSSEGFVVCKDSNIKEQISEKSLNSNIIKLRGKYLQDGTIIDYIFVKDALFTSPSAASDFVLGNSTSGPMMWKNSDGVTLKELNEG